MIDRHFPWFDIAVSLKTKFKRHILEGFHGYSWAFLFGTALVKALGCLEKRKMTKLDFHYFKVHHSNNVYEQS